MDILLLVCGLGFGILLGRGLARSQRPVERDRAMFDAGYHAALGAITPAASSMMQRTLRSVAEADAAAKRGQDPEIALRDAIARNGAGELRIPGPNQSPARP